MNKMSDKKWIATIREMVANFDPTTADENALREHNGRVIYLARVDANNGEVPR